jgi:demethylmenaquinone methyltransferase/2-methoxy-6-polyprenyl-1,4-benzoquinol methylase
MVERETNDIEDVIRDQIRYYRERAPEYDRTTRPSGEFLLPAQERQVQTALADFAPQGKVLEIACGTGSWTKLLAAQASEVTALDASAEMLDLCRRRVPDAHVRFIEVDVFRWEPDAGFDVVFFSNWLSHVPPSRFEEFWNLVERCLAPSGRVFFLDEENIEMWEEEEFLDDTRTLVRRRVGDRAFDIVKIFYDANELENRLEGLGWDVRVHSTGGLYWGEGWRRKTV